MKIAFAGTPHFGALVLGALLSSRHEIALVYTQPDRRAGRGRHEHQSPVKIMAQGEHLRVEQPEVISTPDEVALLEGLGVQALTVAAYGQILKSPLLGALPCINVHASLLPKYRGASPIERAIMAGERVTGVSIMAMAKGLDSGDIYLQRPLEIDDEDDAGSLYDKLGHLGGAALVEVLDALDSNGFVPQPQHEIGVSYAEKIGRADLGIDWKRQAWEVANQVRALSPHIGAYTIAGDHRLKIWKASVAEGGDGPGKVRIEDERLLVNCGTGALELLEVQPEGGRRMGAAEYLRGHREQLEGSRLGA
jgi:methionyl-tRNA formyltransferase